jgi:hypothetical protein
MFTKLISGAAIAAAVLGMGIPAHADAKTTRAANLGGNGIVTFSQSKTGWTVNARVTVPAGKNYVLSFTSIETANGTLVGLASKDVCHFTMQPKDKVAGCNASGKGFAPLWGTKTERPDTFVAEIDQVAANGTRTTVLGPVDLG